MRTWFAIGCAAVITTNMSCNKEVVPPKRATAGAAQPREASLKPGRLRWNGNELPTGLLQLEPRLQWQVSGAGRDKAQTAYQVLVASEPGKLSAGVGDIWDSGKVAASDSVNVRYGGPSLLGRQRGVWTVKVWDEQDRASSFAAPAAFEVAPWDEDVEGDWIGARGQKASGAREDSSVTYLRKVFSVPDGFKTARLHATAFGVYEASINSQRVGQDVLAPGFTDYEKRVLLQTHDVTSLLRAGENVLGVIVAGGWCTARLGGTLGSCGHEPPRARMALEVTLADGKLLTIESDESWKYRSGPILSAQLYGGETYDARKEMAGWDAPGFDESAWQEAAEYDGETERNVYPDPGPPLRVAEDLTAVRETEPARGVYVFDMGKSVAGRARIALNAPAGTRVSLHYGVALRADGSLEAKSRGTDRYVAKGSGTESWEPRFSLHEFRYVEVRGLPARSALKSLTGRVIHSHMPPTGTLETSSPLINQLFAEIGSAQTRAFLSVPMSGREPDERPGSLLQGQAFALTSCLNRDVQAFYRKWIDDIRDAQHENAAYPLFAPGAAAPEAGPSATAAGILVPWAQYRCYADRAALDAHTTSMGRWLEHIKSKNPELVWKDSLGAEPGDPLESGEGTDRSLLATAEFSHAAAALAQMLRHGGASVAATAEPYEALSQGARAAFNTAFVLPDGRLKSDTQTAYAVAIERGVLVDAALERAGQHLAATVERAERRPTTGLLGTALLLPALSRVGRDDLAYALLERLAEPESDHSPSRQLAYAGVGEWMYDAIGGIKLDPAAPAGRHVLVRPRPGAGLTRAHAAFDSAYGRIETDWAQDGKKFRLKLVLPPGSSATVDLPFAGRVSESGAPIAKTTGIEVKSGTYEYIVEQP